MLKKEQCYLLREHHERDSTILSGTTTIPYSHSFDFQRSKSDSNDALGVLQKFQARNDDEGADMGNQHSSIA